jgi:hypothetical protein
MLTKLAQYEVWIDLMGETWDDRYLVSQACSRLAQFVP